MTSRYKTISLKAVTAPAIGVILSAARCTARSRQWACGSQRLTSVVCHLHADRTSRHRHTAALRVAMRLEQPGEPGLRVFAEQNVRSG